MKITIVVVLIGIMIELGGIWIQIMGIRHEQVKNAVHTTRPAVLAKIKASKNASDDIRFMMGQSSIAGTVSVEGSVLEPVHVRIDDTPVPVEIQR